MTIARTICGRTTAEMVLMIMRSVIPAMLCARVFGVGHSASASADVITDWNQTACDVVAKAGAVQQRFARPTGP